METQHGRLYWVLMVAGMLAWAMFQYSQWYVGMHAPAADTGGGWATDFMLALASLCYVLSNYIFAPEKYLVFFLGTALAYGSGGLGHFVETSDDVRSRTIYYIFMTIGFGGDALRAGWGYDLPPSQAVTVQRVFTGVVFGMLFACALLSLRLLRQGYSPDEVAESTVGWLYKVFQIGMGICEATGSLVWYGIMRDTKRRKERFAATAINVASWTVVKVLARYIPGNSTVAWRLSHYCQITVIWLLSSLGMLENLEKNAASQQWLTLEVAGALRNEP